MRVAILVLTVVFSMVTAASSSAQENSATYTERTVIGLEGSDLYRARRVLQRFFATERHPECYRVLFSTFEGNLRVDFAPKRPNPYHYEGEPEGPDLSASCRRAGLSNVGYIGVGYIIDRHGNVLRRVRSR